MKNTNISSGISKRKRVSTPADNIWGDCKLK